MVVRKEQIVRLKRYFISYLKHITLKKLVNLAKVEYKLARSAPDLKNIYPYSLIVEISNDCNLRCPLCQMGKRKIVPRENRMSIENYISLIEPLKDYLFQVSLYNWGEPFLNKDIYEFIEFNTSQNISTVVSSNLNVPVDGNRLVESGLEHLIISADGITQSLYEKYRSGGRIDFVIDNLKKVVKAKQKANSKLPYIEWQCLVTKWNEFQLEDIKKAALDLGADEVRFCNINFYSEKDRHKAEEEWLPRDHIYRKFASTPETNNGGFHKPCFWLWRTAVVNVNGGMTPCCLFDIPDWGNAFDEPFLTVWNNEKYTKARMRFKSKDRIRKDSLICNSCNGSFI